MDNVRCSSRLIGKRVVAEIAPVIVSAIFTALHAMQARSSDENSVCPSVRPSV